MRSRDRLAFSSQQVWAAFALCVVGGLAAASTVTYQAGGTHTVWPQLFYLPIALAAVLTAPRLAVGVAIVAGLLCGPAMPLDRAAGTGQETWSWTLRLAIFVLVALLIAIPATLARRRAQMLERFGGQVVTPFVTAVDGKHPYTARHSESVARYATAITRELGLPPRAIDRIRWAALLHDVGKISTPLALLDKDGPLTDDERAVMERHPVESARIVEGVDRLADSLDGVRHHHERLDGAGYPDRLAGDAVSLDARVLAVADAFDAMTSDRAYRSGMHPAVALDRLVAGAGTQFDEDVVAAFARSVSIEPPTTEAARPAATEPAPLLGSPTPQPRS